MRGIHGVTSLTVLTLAVACRGDAATGNGPRAASGTASPTNAVTPPVTAPGIVTAGSGSAAPAHHPPPGPPPAPVPVPAEIAAKVALRPFVRGLYRPVALVAAPGDRRLFVIEQRGAIRIVKDGAVQKQPFFAIDDLSDGNEQGLLGLAFHPQFATNHTLYVDYTDAEGTTHVVEYKVKADDPDRVDPRSARERLRIAQPYSNHNGGDLVFGPDGKLWIGTGDGGSANDPHGNGQNPKVLLAKMLRLDVDTPDAAAEIVGLGLRNPWRYSFDSKTGDLYIGDVGQNTWENVYAVAHDDLVGHNFGWNVREGRHCFAKDPCDVPGLTAPVVEYQHGALGCSVTGGFVYRGKALPALDGVYFYGDFCTGIVWSFRWTPDGGAVDHWDWRAALDPDGALTNLASFGVDNDGELYALSLDGAIFRFEAK
ncbi:MAG: PQQ-dependent sugar dehydrogenase [Deltaproteobacteria bacterium]|nr:PQQ-dependent sugar dehydrogenase [Deltaproteobacteria bacterium]